MEADRDFTRAKQHRDWLREMLALGREKQEALIGGRLEQLDRVMVAEQALLIRMRALEALPGKGEDIYAGESRGLPGEIMALAGELQEQNRRNRRLARQGLAFLQALEDLGPQSPRGLLDCQA